MLHRISLFMVAVLAFGGISASAAEWGTVKGRIVFDGTAAAPAAITPDKDTEVCSVHPLFDESLQVSDKGGLANVFVYVRTKGVNVHPDYAKSTEPTILDNVNCRFEPHAMGLWVKNPLILKNSDAASHNSKINSFNSPKNPLIPAKGQIEEKFTQDEAVPVEVNCSIHQWMKAYVVLRPDPYFAVTDKDGNFEIKNLPAGKELEFQLWHEKSGYLKDAKFASAKADTRGRLKMKVKVGDNDLGEAKMAASLFNKK